METSQYSETMAGWIERDTDYLRREYHLANNARDRMTGKWSFCLVANGVIGSFDM